MEITCKHYIPATYAVCATCSIGGYCHFKCRNYEPKEEKKNNMESITENGISTTQTNGQEQYSKFVAGAFRGTLYYQYDYRHTDGTLFSTVAHTLEECRKQKEEWLNKK